MSISLYSLYVDCPTLAIVIDEHLQVDLAGSMIRSCSCPGSPAPDPGRHSHDDGDIDDNDDEDSAGDEYNDNYKVVLRAWIPWRLLWPLS